MKYHKILIAGAMASTLALGGCLDFLDTDDDDDSPSGSLSGKAADGYLQSATVCLDLNANKVCDRGEPSATTGPDGDFTINAEDSQISSASIVVEVIAGTTIDKDDGQVISKAYSLTAPAGYSFVSPITTLVQAKVEELGSLAEAESSVQAAIGTTIDFDADYIAGQSDTLASAEAQAAFEALHQVAQVVATIMANNLDANSIDQDSGNFEAVLDLVVAKVEVVLSTIVEQVETAGDNFDPDTIAANDEIANATNVDPETLEAELALQDDLENAVQADFQALLSTSQGMHWLEYDFDLNDAGTAHEVEIGYGLTTFDGTTTLNKFFGWNGSAFVEMIDDGSGDNSGDGSCDTAQDSNCPEEHAELFLTSSGWTAPSEEEHDDDGPIFSGYDADGSVLMDEGPITIKLAGEEFSLAGNNVQGSLFGTGNWGWGESVSTTATYGDGSKGYKIHMFTANDVYLLPDFSEGCEEDGGVNNIAGDCNLMEFFAPGDQEPTYKASDFSPIVTTRGTDSDPSTYTALALAGGEGYAILAEFGPNNTIFYYEIELTNDQVTSMTKVLEAPYEQKTVHGKSLIVFDVPFQLVPDFFEGGPEDEHTGGGEGTASAEPEMHEDDDDMGPRPTAIFITAHEGYWRFGGLLKAGTPIPDDAPYVYNKTAMDSIKSAFDDGSNLFVPPLPTGATAQ